MANEHELNRPLLARLGASLVAALLLWWTGAEPYSRTADAQAQGPIQVARLGFVEGGAEIQHSGAGWARVAEGDPLLIGDRVRTLRGGTARLDFPWTAIVMGDGSEIAIQSDRVLTLRLEKGRIDIDPEQALLRVVTGEAAISGSGRTLIRREANATFVGSYGGGANVEAQGTTVRLGLNKGTLVSPGATPGEATPMGDPPRVVSPAANPRYVLPGEPVHLTWSGAQSAYHLEVLSIDSDIPVISVDVDAREFDLRLNWLGTFRWRVSGRAGPVETQASGEGLLCAVEK